MSLHRLPLFRPTQLPGDAYQGAPRALPVRTVAVLDPGEGGLSLAFAARFGSELVQRGRLVRVALASFEREPALEAWQRAALRQLEPLQVCSTQASDAELGQLFGREPHALWVVVGQAALGFTHELTILLGAELPLLRWPDPLREARERISLAISGAGLAVASALAEAAGAG